jgi:dolichyl-phosphate beta-glucosyltransferase
MPCHLELIVPCYNEAARLREAAFLDFVRQQPSTKLLFVDDGSTDETAAIHRRLAAAAPGRISALGLERNRGKAEAVRRGLLEAMGRGPALVGFWDADLATPLAAVDDFLLVAAKHPGVDLMLGSRVLLMGRDIRRKATRHYLGRVFATAASLALDLPVYDTQCGAKIFRVNEATRRVFAAPFRSPWIFDVEILARYLAQPVDDGGAPRRARIYELAVPAWQDVPGSKLRVSDFVRSMFDLVAVWRDRRAGQTAASDGAGTRSEERGARGEG